MKVYKPNWYQKSIYTINYDRLKQQGVKYLIFDLDNTLGFINEEVCSDKVKHLIKEISNDFTIIVASNNNRRRVAKFCDGITSDMIAYSLKPSGRIYRHMKKYTKNMQEVCIIGDQIVTDIIAGNRFSMKTILVDPLGDKDLKITSLNRFIEKKLITKISLKKGEYYEED